MWVKGTTTKQMKIQTTKQTPPGRRKVELYTEVMEAIKGSGLWAKVQWEPIATDGLTASKMLRTFLYKRGMKVEIRIEDDKLWVREAAPKEEGN